MHRLRTLSVALAGLAVLLPAAPAPADDARPAAAFGDSVGVTVHLSYTDTRYADWAAVLAGLRELGVRHVRDRLILGRPDLYERLGTLAAEGVGIDLVIDPRSGPVDQLLDQAARLPGIASLEGANELDLTGSPDWPAIVRAHQWRLRFGDPTDLALGAIPVLGPSFGRAESATAVGALGELMHFGNLHSYPGGRAPASNLSEALATAGMVSGALPVFATETGYHNALADATGHPGISERAAGLWIPALLLEYFRSGVRRTFLYELLDERPEPAGTDREAHFGLLRSDFSPKPAYLAVQRLLRLLDDDGSAAFTPRPLDFALAGDTSRVRRVLMQKSDGSWWLALWQDAEVWDPAARKDLFPAPAEVRLTLRHPAARMDVYAAASSLQPDATVMRARELMLSIPVSGVLVRIQPPARCPRSPSPSLR
jgi:hypothetical protein